MAIIRRILFPYDFSAQGQQAVPYVSALASRLGARVTLLSVVPPVWEAAPAAMGPLSGADPVAWIGALRDRLEQALIPDFAGIEVERIADAGDPALRTAACAVTKEADLIMMPTHGLGLFRSLVIGSVTAAVLHEAHCPVWTSAHAETQRARTLPQTVLCAVDATPEGSALLRWADEFCRGVGAQLKLLHVVGPVTDWPALDREQRLQEQVRQQSHDRIADVLREVRVTAPLRTAVGNIVDTVADEARQDGADLVIIGRGAIAEPFGRLRTHAFGIVQRSPCPVLSV